MADVFDPQKRRAIMQAIRRAGTTHVGTRPEIAVARFFEGIGYRPLREPSELTGRPDLYFPRVSLVVFVHGCFWHGHDGCRKGTQRPKSNVSFWTEKILRNRRRDARVARRLRDEGYHVYVIWECQLRHGRPPVRVVNAVLKAHLH